MRDPSTYRGARKQAARDAGSKLSDAPFRKIDIRPATKAKKGFALPLKAVDGGVRLARSEKSAGKFVPDPEPMDLTGESLVSVGIVRDGKVINSGFKSHGELRSALGDADAWEQKQRNDIEGFMTSAGRFLTRAQAVPIGIASGQLTPSWKDVRRPLLSSDIW